MSETYTGPLQNVLVNTTTLKEYVPNIEDYLLTDSGQTDFESFEKVVKRKVYREISKKLGDNPLDDVMMIYSIKSKTLTEHITSEIRFIMR